MKAHTWQYIMLYQFRLTYTLHQKRYLRSSNMSVFAAGLWSLTVRKNCGQRSAYEILLRFGLDVNFWKSLFPFCTLYCQLIEHSNIRVASHCDQCSSTGNPVTRQPFQEGVRESQARLHTDSPFRLSTWAHRPLSYSRGTTRGGNSLYLLKEKRRERETT